MGWVEGKRVSEPSVSKGRTGTQRGREKRSPPPPPLRLLPLFPFIFPQQPEELLTVCQRCLGKKWGLMGPQNQPPSLSHCISSASPTLPLRWVQLPPEPVATTAPYKGTLGVRHQTAKPHCFRTKVWEGWLAALCSNSQRRFSSPLSCSFALNLCCITSPWAQCCKRPGGRGQTSRGRFSSSRSWLWAAFSSASPHSQEITRQGLAQE